MAIRHVNWFFNLFTGWAIVRERSLLRGPQMLRLLLDELGCAESKSLPEEVLTTIVQEAYRRAAEKESDNLARYGPLHEQYRLISMQVAAALRKDPIVDARVKSILEWNKLI